MQTNKKIFISLGIACIGVLIVIGLFNLRAKNFNYDNHDSALPSNADSVNPETQSTATTTPASNTWTLADIALHATEQDCWTVIDGSVYNLTDFISLHPGGKKGIISICGKDGSEAFHGKHGDGNRGTEKVFDQHLIGIIK